MKQRELIFKYFLDTNTIINDKKKWKISTINNQAIFDAIALCDFLILDTEKLNNTIYIKDVAIGFCYNFLLGLEKLRSDNNFEGFMLSLYDHYSFIYYLDNETLVIKEDNKVYKYDFKRFYNLFNKFSKKVLSDLIFYYPELNNNPHFQLIYSKINGV